MEDEVGVEVDVEWRDDLQSSTNYSLGQRVSPQQTARLLLSDCSTLALSADRHTWARGVKEGNGYLQGTSCCCSKAKGDIDPCDRGELQSAREISVGFFAKSMK